MKNLFYATLALFMVGVLTSCGETEDILPSESNSLNIKTTQSTDDYVVSGQKISFTALLTSTDKNLRTFEVSGPVDYAELSVENIIDTEKDDSGDKTLKNLRAGDEYVYTNDKQVAYTVNYTVSQNDIDEALDNDGKMEFMISISDKSLIGSGSTGVKTAKVEFMVQTATPLEEADFKAERSGGADATGLDAYGLAWTSNTNTSAIIKKDADKLVKLSAEDYENITSVEALMAAVDAADDMDDFRDVSVSESKDYDLVIATKKGDDYFMINITRADVKTATAGTTVTVTGKVKN
ncbi:hypothetical protein [Persicobacter psychrovividus]|uniref:Uncharacterized protein n=1 Tax=Persicobacter psychrovividus TaxID=387638 RepID=A0ABN6L8N7_9BACT|nr:hypothetical protein PEPS_18410 [Persicobacter psychrovividus]